MHNNKFMIIFSTLLFTLFLFTSCNANDPLSLKEESKLEENNPPKNENNRNKQSTKPDTTPKAAEPTPQPKSTSPAPAPKASPKKSTAKTKRAKRPVNRNLILSSFSTPIIDYDNNRIYNIRLAGRKVNNYILAPGEVFSFNKVVGERSPGKGYRKATILVQGERDAGVGGGVCQLSSTIYNAAAKLGLQIMERHTHSADVHYVPVGQDAAVNYGDKDLQFKNTKDYSVKFKVSVLNGRVSVSILKVLH